MAIGYSLFNILYFFYTGKDISLDDKAASRCYVTTTINSIELTIL